MMRMLMIRSLMMRARMMRQPLVATKRQRKALAHVALSDYDPSSQIPVHCDGLYCGTVFSAHIASRLVGCTSYSQIPIFNKATQLNIYSPSNLG